MRLDTRELNVCSEADQSQKLKNKMLNEKKLKQKKKQLNKIKPLNSKQIRIISPAGGGSPLLDGFVKELRLEPGIKE